jgi:hypothetical protein
MTAGVVLTAGMVVQMLCRQLCVRAGGADLQQERRAVRRHEPERHIGAKQQDAEHQAGREGASMMMEQAHTAVARCQSVREFAIGGYPFDVPSSDR